MVMRMLRTQIKWIMISIWALFVLSVLFMYGPMRGGRQQGGQSDYPVAKFEGQKIMRSQIEEGLRRLADQRDLGAVTSADLPGLRKSVLDSIVLERELANEARTRGFEPSAEEIDKTLNQIKDQFPTIEAFNQYVERNGIDLKALRDQVSSQLAQQKLIENEMSAAVVSSGDVSAYYDQFKDIFFRRPAGWEINVARFRGEAVAREALNDLEEGQAWDVVLEEKSADVVEKTSYAQPAFFPDSAFSGELAPLASLDAGQYSEPLVISSDDVAVFLKRDRLDQETLSLDEVSGDIQNLLISQEQSKLRQTFFQSLIDRADLEILDEALFKAPVKADNGTESEKPASPDQTQ